MSTMAKTISEHLHHDMDRVVPTTVVMVALVSSILGVVFLTMGMLRVTSIANYMPYPVIAGFLSGIGAELIRNGVHMAAEEILTMKFFSWEQQLLAWPAIMFAALARLGQHLRVPVAISFPCLLVASLSGFHVIARTILGRKMHDLEAEGWLFPWPADVVQATPMWYPWAKIDLSLVSWHVLVYECFGYLVTLVILGALKYSVSTTSLSTLFGREISPDNEMRVIGLANIVSGLLGCCGGCHYLSAMGIMKQFQAHEKVPALVCALLLLMMWVVGIRALQFVPKFVFGGLILSVGVHFLEAYFIAPFAFLKRFEKGIVILITLSFLVIGMLEAVGLGVIISMIDLIYRIHEVGCVHHETTGQLSRSSVDRTADQVAYLDAHGNSVFVLRLQGYLFFGTSVNILERIETRMRSLELPKLQYVIIDFGLVPNFDATALLNFRKATVFAERLGFEIYFCGLKKPIELELKRNAAAAPATANTTKVHYLSGNVDLALEECENRLLPTELQPHLRGTPDDWKRMSQLTLWEHFIGLQQHKVATGVSIEDEASGRMKKLLPLAAYLDKQIVLKDAVLNSQGVLTDTFFICYGYINIMIKSEFASGAIPGLGRQDSLTAGSSSSDEEGFSTRVRRASRLTSEESQWLAFTTAKERLRKIGPGSIITPDTIGEISADFYQYIATSDCVLLRLRPLALESVETKAPHTAVAVMKIINEQVATRFLYANKRVTQLSSLLYK
jgi:MFS superfamily sulfate permease-like transporter